MKNYDRFYGILLTFLCLFIRAVITQDFFIIYILNTFKRRTKQKLKR
jgi:hypothetical protein